MLVEIGEMYWIKPRKLWGDYGNVLFHGNDYTAREGDGAPIGSTVLQMCSPYSEVLLPSGLFLCTGRIVELLRGRKIAITVEDVWVECQVEVPIDRWLKRGEPKYPRGGEPESYFEQYYMERDFESGFGNEIFRILHDGTVPASKARWSKENPDPTPKIEGAWPTACHLVLGKISPNAKSGPLFCSQVFAEILTVLECDNFELIPMN